MFSRFQHYEFLGVGCLLVYANCFETSVKLMLWKSIRKIVVTGRIESNFVTTMDMEKILNNEIRALLSVKGFENLRDFINAILLLADSRYLL